MEKKLRDAIIRLENFANEYAKLCDQVNIHSPKGQFYLGKMQAYDAAANILRNQVLGEYDGEGD